MDRYEATSLESGERKTISNGIETYTTSISGDSLFANRYVASCQLGFISIIVAPIYDIMNRLIPVPDAMENLTANNNLWSK